MIGKSNILKKISDESNPRIKPKKILIDQLSRAIMIVSNSLPKVFTSISWSNLGLKVVNINSLNRSIPPRWKFFINS